MDWSLTAQAVLGIVVFVALAVPFSTAPRSIDWKIVGVAIALQFAICALLLKVPAISAAFRYLTMAVNGLSTATGKGTTFLFGYLGGGEAPFPVTGPGSMVTFAFQVLPLVIVMSALSALLWYWRVLPVIIHAIAKVFERTLDTRGPAGLVAVANIFVGQVEAPLLVRPYIANMTRYEILLLMTAGMATIAGSVMVIYAAMLGPFFDGALGHLLTKSVMAVPGSVMFAHILIPERAADHDVKDPPRIYTGTMDAVTRGTQDGLNIYLGILAVLLVLIAFVAMVNGAVGLLPAVGGEALTLERLAGWVFAPLAWLMGVSWAEAQTVGSLVGVKTVLNEFIAFIQLTRIPADQLGEHARLIATYALCGFANISSMGIQIGGIGTMVPERKADLAAMAPKALLAATLGSLLAGAIVGLVV